MPDGPLFLTGATGFIGRAVLPLLAEQPGADLRCLVRGSGNPPSPAPTVGVRWIRGDLEDPDGYRAHLPAGGTVLHMAALTGKAGARRHREVNGEATRRLVVEARAAGVERFVFMSSIVAGFPDRRAYPYARAKVEAEAAVRDGGMRWVILRPTQVFGPGSPVLAGLTRLASTPVGIRFGSGTVRMQPIDVDDVARAVRLVLAEDRWDGRVVDLGGPDAPTAAHLLEQIRLRTRGRSGPWLPVPVGPVRWGLALVEPLLHRVLPLSAGQLAPFAAGNDSAGAPVPELWDALPPRTDLGTMLDRELAP